VNVGGVALKSESKQKSGTDERRQIMTVFSWGPADDVDFIREAAPLFIGAKFSSGKVRTHSAVDKMTPSPVCVCCVIQSCGTL